jgi:hypothetical protein
LSIPTHIFSEDHVILGKWLTRATAGITSSYSAAELSAISVVKQILNPSSDGKWIPSIGDALDVGLSYVTVILSGTLARSLKDGFD